MGRLLGGSYELLLGRRTYEIFDAYWPHNGDQSIGATFNAVRKHVVTSSDRPLTWNNSQRLVGDPAEAVARLKASDGPDLLIQGSSMIYQALLPARLVDQLALITFPVMLGRGKRWYSGDPATARSWTLVEQTHSPKGVHFASFARGEGVRRQALVFGRSDDSPFMDPGRADALAKGRPLRIVCAWRRGSPASAGIRAIRRQPVHGPWSSRRTRQRASTSHRLRVAKGFAGKRWYSGDPATARSWTLVEQTHSPKGVHFASFARGEGVRRQALVFGRSGDSPFMDPGRADALAKGRPLRIVCAWRRGSPASAGIRAIRRQPVHGPWSSRRTRQRAS